MYLILALILSFFLPWLDQSIVSMMTMFVILIIGLVFCLEKNIEDFKYNLKLFGITFCIYTTCSYLFSLCFSESTFYMVSDSMRYIWRYKSSIQPDYYGFAYIRACYLQITDTNALYNFYLNYMCALANLKSSGATVFYITLLHTGWGTLLAIVVQRILRTLVDRKKAFKHALYFTLCAHVLFYSCVIIRDIIIVFCFAQAFYILIKPLRYYNLGILFLLILLAWGIRLYSGMFLCTFFIVFIYFKTNNSTLKNLLIPFFILFLIFSLLYMSNSQIAEQTTSELDKYSNMTETDAITNGGLYTMFYRLPIGIRQIALLFYTQIAPFPPYLGIFKCTNVSQLLMKLTHVFFEVYWYAIFYYIVLAIWKFKAWNTFTQKEYIYGVLALIFIIANTAHPDLRRMLPVYPITLYLYVKIKQTMSIPQTSYIHSYLKKVYLLCLILYNIIKF